MNDKERERIFRLIREAYPVKTTYEELHEMAQMSPWVWSIFSVIVGAAVAGLLIWGRV